MREDRCSSCNLKLESSSQYERTPCPECGEVKRIVQASVNESMQAFDGLGYKIKDPKRTGKSKIKSEGFVKYSKSTEARLVKHSRHIDREKNLYSEHVVNVESGKVIHECEEPLDQHTGHGSARTKKVSS